MQELTPLRNAAQPPTVQRLQERPRNVLSCLGQVPNGALRLYFLLALAGGTVGLTDHLTAAVFPVLNSETRLAGSSGPVAISGDTAIVGNLVYARTPAGWLFQQVLDGPGAVALDGDTAQVGTNVYVRVGTHWNLQSTLPFSYWSGYESTALAHDVLAVGVPWQYLSNKYDVGTVYIYTRTNAIWSLQSQLIPNPLIEETAFGASIGLDGQVLVAGGAGNYSSTFVGPPSAFIFAQNGASWSQRARLTNNHLAAFRFGAAVAVSSNTIAVGAQDPSAPLTVFVAQSGQWIKQQTLYWGGTYLPYHEPSVNTLSLLGDTVAACDINGAIHIATRRNALWTAAQLLTTGGTNHLGPGIHVTTNALIAASANGNGAYIFERRSWSWQQQDIGNVGAQGSFSTTANVLTESGAGADIGGTTDAFHFVHRPYSNDLEMIVRVVSVGGTDPWSRGGIMLRGGLDSSAPFVYLSQRQSGEITFQSRSVTGAEADFDSGPWVGFPYWLKMRKLGSNFVASVSQDGTSWYDIASATVNLPSTFYIGVGTTSHQAGTLAVDVFDHISIAPIALPRAPAALTAIVDGVDRVNLSWVDNSDNESAFLIKEGPYYVAAILPANTTNYTVTELSPTTAYSFTVEAIEPHGFGSESEPAIVTTPKLPPPWQDQDIGLVQLPGQAGFDSGRFVVSSGATNTDVDGLHFVYRQWTGDFDFRATIRLNQMGYGTGKAGLMIRSSLASNSPYAFAFITPWGENAFEVGNVSGTGAAAPGWFQGELRMVRRGNTFSVFHQDSSGSVGISLLTEQTINLPSSVYLGFAVAGVDTWGRETADCAVTYLAGGSDVHAISPPVLTATPISPTQVRLSWADTNANSVSYELIYFKTNYLGSGYYDVAWLSSNATSYVDTSVVAGMTRYYRLLVHRGDGDSLWSNFAPATTPLPVYNVPRPWQMARIGTVSTATATINESNRSFSVWNSSVGGSSGTSDNCTGIFCPMVGDGSITAHFVGAVDADGVTYPTGKFGIMIRQSLAPRSAVVSAFFNETPSLSISFVNRQAQGTILSTNFVNYPGTYWVRLVRSGLAVDAYSSYDGITWTQIGSGFNSIIDPALAGLFVSSENSSLLVGATFDNVQIGPPQPPLLVVNRLSNNDQLTIQVQSLPGWSNQLQISPDLIHWEPWTNWFNFSGTFEIEDPQAYAHPSRFYRMLIEN